MVHILIRRGSPITIVDKSFRSWNNDNRHVIEALIKAGSWWINGSTNHGGVPNTPPSPRCLKPMPALLSPPTALSKNQIVHRSIVKFSPNPNSQECCAWEKRAWISGYGLSEVCCGKDIYHLWNSGLFCSGVDLCQWPYAPWPNKVKVLPSFLKLDLPKRLKTYGTVWYSIEKVYYSWNK